MGPRTHISGSTDPDRVDTTRYQSPCCHAAMDVEDVACSACGEPCEPVVDDCDDRGEEW